MPADDAICCSTVDMGALVRAEMQRMRARGCTKSEHNLYHAACRKVRNRR